MSYTEYQDSPGGDTIGTLALSPTVPLSEGTGTGVEATASVGGVSDGVMSAPSETAETVAAVGGVPGGVISAPSETAETVQGANTAASSSGGIWDRTSSSAKQRRPVLS